MPPPGLGRGFSHHLPCPAKPRSGKMGPLSHRPHLHGRRAALCGWRDRMRPTSQQKLFRDCSQKRPYFPTPPRPSRTREPRPCGYELGSTPPSPSPPPLPPKFTLLPQRLPTPSERRVCIVTQPKAALAAGCALWYRYAVRRTVRTSSGRGLLLGGYLYFLLC